MKPPIQFITVSSVLTASIFTGSVLIVSLLLSAGPALGEDPDNIAASRTEGSSCDNSLLTIMVTGDGKPVPQAEVIVMYAPTGEAPEGCSEGKLPPTNDDGKIAFSSGGKGKVRIVVIAADWDTCQDHVNLKKGNQTHQISLRRTERSDHE